MSSVLKILIFNYLSDDPNESLIVSCSPIKLSGIKFRFDYSANKSFPSLGFAFVIDSTLLIKISASLLIFRLIYSQMAGFPLSARLSDGFLGIINISKRRKRNEEKNI
jgi:hypothetical protein